MSEEPAIFPASTADMARGFEHHLWTMHPGQLGIPKVNLLVVPADRSRGLKPVNLPFAPGDIERFGKILPNAPGRFGAALAGMAYLVNRLETPQLAAALATIYEPGDQLVMATVISDVIAATADNIPPYSRSIADDVPEQNREDLRAFLAADGLGNAWYIGRDPATGQIHAEDEQSCYPIQEHIAEFTEAPEGDGRLSAGGLIPWALAVLCISMRAHLASTVLNP